MPIEATCLLSFPFLYCFCVTKWSTRKCSIPKSVLLPFCSCGANIIKSGRSPSSIDSLSSNPASTALKNVFVRPLFRSPNVTACRKQSSSLLFFSIVASLLWTSYKFSSKYLSKSLWYSRSCTTRYFSNSVSACIFASCAEILPASFSTSRSSACK